MVALVLEFCRCSNRGNFPQKFQVQNDEGRSERFDIALSFPHLARGRLGKAPTAENMRAILSPVKFLMKTLSQ